MFLTGANVLQTQATAAGNGGCGIIAVNELKSGKSRFTDTDGSYGSMLDFADPDVKAKSYRQAEYIPEIKMCRMQMIGAGVKEDWISFIEKSGKFSGMMARIIPIIGYDRAMVRLDYERLAQYEFSLTGLKKVLTVMERHFQQFRVSSRYHGITLQFSQSRLDKEYRKTNGLLLAGFRNGNAVDYRSHYRTLLDHGPPGTSLLLRERSGCGVISVFIEQSLAVYSPLVMSDADETFLRGLEDNLLKIASDFYWAWKLPSYLNRNGELTAEEENRLETDMEKITGDRMVTIPDVILPSLLQLLTYILKGTFLLNKLATDQPLSSVPMQPKSRGSQKRYRIVKRLAEGVGRAKKRRFFVCNLMKAMRQISREEIEQEVRVLKSHAVVDTPTHRSVTLERDFNDDAMKYLKVHCGYGNDAALAQLVQATAELTD